MVRPRCIVSYCKNQGRHKFPKDEARKNLWIQAIKHVKPKYNFGIYSGVCSDHFRLSDFSSIPSYWNNYHPARILKKSAVPSVFDWNKEVEDEQSEEQPSSSIDDTLSFVSDLLVVEVEELSPAQDTVSFNPERVKATYSKGQTSKAIKPNAEPSLQNIDKPQTQNSTFQNAKNTSSYTRLKPTKRPSHQDIDNEKFLTPAVSNNCEKRLKITNKPPNNSNIIGKVFTKIELPKYKGKPPCLPPKVTIKSEKEVPIDDNLTSNSIFTSCLPLEVNIKTEQEVDSIGTQNEAKSSLSLPSGKVTIKTEPDEEKSSLVEVEIEMTPVKHENNEDMLNTNL